MYCVPSHRGYSGQLHMASNFWVLKLRSLLKQLPDRRGPGQSECNAEWGSKPKKFGSPFWVHFVQKESFSSLRIFTLFSWLRLHQYSITPIGLLQQHLPTILVLWLRLWELRKPADKMIKLCLGTLYSPKNWRTIDSSCGLNIWLLVTTP